MHKKLQHDLSGPLTCFVDSDHAADKDTSLVHWLHLSLAGPNQLALSSPKFDCIVYD